MLDPEVDASDFGVGPVFFQHARPDQNLPPCACFSYRLTPPQTNYNVGDGELLSVNLVLHE